MGPPITYILEGKQYVALMGGTGAIANRGPGGGAGGGGAGGGDNAPAPDIAGAQAQRAGGAPAAPAGPPATPPVSPKLLVFRLDGKAALPTAPAVTGR